MFIRNLQKYKMFFSISLIAIGVIFLLKNLGVISGEIWGLIWPTLIILLGLSLLLRPRKRHFWTGLFNKEEE